MTTTHKTHDLGQGFFFNLYDDGSATMRNCDKGLRIDLPKESVELLRAISRDPGFDPTVPTGFDKAIEEAMRNGHRDLAQRIRDERRMCRALVNACLERGFLVSVSDGEDWPVSQSTDKAEIMAALFSTDEDVIVIYDSEGRKAGWFQLIYGNDGWDVVSDYSDNAVCNAIWEEVLRPLSDKIEEGR